MKILIFAALYYPFNGGYVESIHALAKRITAQGHQITIVTCNTHHTSSKEQIDGINIVRLPCFNPPCLNRTFPIPLPFPQTFQLLRDALQPKPNIISTQTRFFPTSWLGFLIARLKRIPTIHTERGATHSVSFSRIIALIAKIIDHTFGWIIARFSNATVGVSETSCAFLQHLGAKNPIKIYNGIDIEFWRKPKNIQNYKNIQEIQDDKIVVTFVGRLIYAKGVQDLLRAIDHLKKKQEYRSITVNIIGDGPYRLTLEKLASELELNDIVRFFGEMTKKQIRDILWQTDIFVNTSYSEGFPRSVLEAAAVGLPIIATDTGGTREIITNQNGHLVPIKNIDRLNKTIINFFDNPANLLICGQQVQAYVKKKFDWDSITQQYLDLFSSI